jgi:hypothetical protein
MKKNIRSEIENMISGNTEHVDIIVIDDYECQPGYYRTPEGKIINEQEKQELERRCNKLVIFTLAKDKTT